MQSLIQDFESFDARAKDTGKEVFKKESKTKSRQFGVLKGKIKIADDFNVPLPEDILVDFAQIERRIIDYLPMDETQ